MIDDSNPAGRLHKILSEAKSQRDGKSVRDVWTTVLQCDNSDVSITKAVVALYSLSQEVQSLIRMNDDLKHELYLHSFRKLDQVFFPLNLNDQWQGPKGHLTEEALTRLQFCAYELQKFYTEESLSAEELDSVVRLTNELFDSVYKSQLPDILRLSLLAEIEKIRRAMSLYKIHGARGLKEALQSTIGAMVANQAELKSVPDDGIEVLRKLGELIDKLDSFTARVLKLKRMLTKPVQFLLLRITDPENIDCVNDENPQP